MYIYNSLYRRRTLTDDRYELIQLQKRLEQLQDQNPEVISTVKDEKRKIKRRLQKLSRRLTSPTLSQRVFGIGPPRYTGKDVEKECKLWEQIDKIQELL